jgi:hypothetical protein
VARATRYCFAPLLEPLRLPGCVITAVAVHTQREHAQFLVSDKQAHYVSDHWP